MKPVARMTISEWQIVWDKAGHENNDGREVIAVVWLVQVNCDWQREEMIR
jgi:hypothetical protein